MAGEILSAERLREVVRYDAGTGFFFRRIRTAQRHQAGDRADFLIATGGLRGYYRISIDSQRYLAHRVAWLYVHGVWPDTIDHINGNRSDNRIANLRNGTQAQNVQNRRTPDADNKCGYLGVEWHPGTGKWRSRISVNGRTKHIGLFATPQEAHDAYVKEKRKRHEFCSI